MKRLKNSSWIIARRIYIAPSAYETWFITDAALKEDLISRFRPLIVSKLN
jgi:hypothetical protein